MGRLCTQAWPISTLWATGADAESGYEEQQQRIAAFVESVGADGLYEFVEERLQ